MMHYDENTQLALQAAQGDSASWDILYARYHRPIRRGIRQYIGIKNKDAIDDIEQTIWLKCVRNIGSFRADSLFGSWMAAICRNARVDFIRKQQRDREYGMKLENSSPAEASVMDSTLEFDDLVAQCPEQYRAVLCSIYRDGYGIAETAQAVGSSYEATRSMIRRARHWIYEHRVELGIDRGTR